MGGNAKRLQGKPKWYNCCVLCVPSMEGFGKSSEYSFGEEYGVLAFYQCERKEWVI